MENYKLKLLLLILALLVPKSELRSDGTNVPDKGLQSIRIQCVLPADIKETFIADFKKMLVRDAPLEDDGELVTLHYILFKHDVLGSTDKGRWESAYSEYEKIDVKSCRIEGQIYEYLGTSITVKHNLDPGYNKALAQRRDLTNGGLIYSIRAYALEKKYVTVTIGNSPAISGEVFLNGWRLIDGEDIALKDNHLTICANWKKYNDLFAEIDMTKELTVSINLGGNPKTVKYINKKIDAGGMPSDSGSVAIYEIDMVAVPVAVLTEVSKKSSTMVSITPEMFKHKYNTCPKEESYSLPYKELEIGIQLGPVTSSYNGTHLAPVIDARLSTASFQPKASPALLTTVLQHGKVGFTAILPVSASMGGAEKYGTLDGVGYVGFDLLGSFWFQHNIWNVSPGIGLGYIWQSHPSYPGAYNEYSSSSLELRMGAEGLRRFSSWFLKGSVWLYPFHEELRQHLGQGIQSNAQIQVGFGAGYFWGAW